MKHDFFAVDLIRGSWLRQRVSGGDERLPCTTTLATKGLAWVVPAAFAGVNCAWNGNIYLMYKIYILTNKPFLLLEAIKLICMKPFCYNSDSGTCHRIYETAISTWSELARTYWRVAPDPADTSLIFCAPSAGTITNCLPIWARSRKHFLLEVSVNKFTAHLLLNGYITQRYYNLDVAWLKDDEIEDSAVLFRVCSSAQSKRQKCATRCSLPNWVYNTLYHQ